MNLSDCPFRVTAATDAEADRGSAAERAEDPKSRRRPNRLAVSPQNRVISTAARTVKREIIVSFCPLNELVRVSELLCRFDSEDIYGLFRMELAMYYFLKTQRIVVLLYPNIKRKIT